MRRLRLFTVFTAVLACAAFCCALLRAGDEGCISLTEQLGGPDRTLAFLSTDKPLYRAGETVFGRALIVYALRRMPAPGSPVSFTVRSPSGRIVLSATSDPQGGVAAFSWRIPPEAAGGEYRLKAEFPESGAAPAEIGFDVLDFRTRSFKELVEYDRDGYGPGDRVSVFLALKLLCGDPIGGASVRAGAWVDGAEIAKETLKTAADGSCSFCFDLPREMSSGEGVCSFAFARDGLNESVVRAIPIVMPGDATMEFWHESGKPVIGLANRFYFEARGRRGAPIQVAGRVVDRGGKTVATFDGAHEGRGSFSFVPAPFQSYTAVIDRPSGVSRNFGLPRVFEHGLVLSAESEIYSAGRPMRFRIASTKACRARLALCKMELETASLVVNLKPMVEQSVSLTPHSAVEGVLRASLYDDRGTVLAERLVFRRPSRELKVKVSASRRVASPGSPVSVEVRVTDDRNRPVKAVVFICATDDGVIQRVLQRERPPRLPEQVLLESEVKDFKDCGAYLGGAAHDGRNVDLLLGTQGFRRFAFSDHDAFMKKHGNAALRVLAFADAPEPVILPSRDWPTPSPAPTPAPPPPGSPQPSPTPKPFSKDEPDEYRRAWSAQFRSYPAEDGAILRQYSHKRRTDRDDARSDFTDTLFWSAGAVTGPDGYCKIEFALSDSITLFRVRADAIAADGSLGAGDAIIECSKPFALWHRMPAALTAGDEVEIPVRAVNVTSRAMNARILVKSDGEIGMDASERTLRLRPDSSERILVAVRAGKAGVFGFSFRAAASGFTDAVGGRVEVERYGAPVDLSFSGYTAKGVASVVRIPQGVEPEHVSARAFVSADSLSMLDRALKGLTSRPHGCLEQICSVHGLDAMALQYMFDRGMADRARVADARARLRRGLEMIARCRCEGGGFSWFPGGAASEVLSAYALTQLIRMSRVSFVDGRMIAGTRDWLLSRRDGLGGFLRGPGDPPDTPPALRDAYILLALLRSDCADLDSEVDALSRIAKDSSDPCLLGLAANAFALAGEDTKARRALAALAALQDSSGAVRGAIADPIGSGGGSLETQAAALAVLGWLRYPQFARNAAAGAGWILARMRDGAFGNTQATALALEAVVEYNRAASSSGPGKRAVRLKVDTADVGRLELPDRPGATLEFPGFNHMIWPGERSIELAPEDGFPAAWEVRISYFAQEPPHAGGCPVRLSAALSRDEAAEGEIVGARVSVRNSLRSRLPMTVARVSLPAGLQPRLDELKGLAAAGRFDHFEIRGRELTFYWTEMEALASVDIELNLVAEIPGRYRGNCSCAYLYYTDEHKHWIPGMAVRISAAGG